MTTWKDFEFEDLSVALTLENQQVRMGLLKCQHKKNGFQNHFFLLPPGSDGGRRSLAAPGMVLGLSTLPTSPPLQLSRCHCTPPQGHPRPPPSTSCRCPQAHIPIHLQTSVCSIRLLLGCGLRDGTPSNFPAELPTWPSSFSRDFLSHNFNIFLATRGTKAPTQWLYQSHLLTSHRRHVSV